MQTFIVSRRPDDIASILDTKRLGKQRVEAIQIVRKLLDLPNMSGKESKAWNNHPAVRMWKGYEPYLVKVYLFNMIDEWANRGKNGRLCRKHFLHLIRKVRHKKIVEPHWFKEDVFNSHKSNLLRKDSEYYSKFFSDVSNDLEYIWPSQNQKEES